MTRKKFRNTHWSCKSVFDYEDNIQSPISAWISGHTHCSKHIVLESGSHLISNSHGFEKDNSKYNPDKVFLM